MFGSNFWGANHWSSNYWRETQSDDTPAGNAGDSVYLQAHREEETILAIVNAFLFMKDNEGNYD